MLVRLLFAWVVSSPLVGLLFGRWLRHAGPQLTLACSYGLTGHPDLHAACCGCDCPHHLAVARGALTPLEAPLGTSTRNDSNPGLSPRVTVEQRRRLTPAERV